jgi:hypothetical protein
MIISLREKVLVGCCLDLGDDEEQGALGARDENVQILSFQKGVAGKCARRRKEAKLRRASGEGSVLRAAGGLRVLRFNRQGSTQSLGRFR